MSTHAKKAFVNKKLFSLLSEEEKKNVTIINAEPKMKAGAGAHAAASHAVAGEHESAVTHVPVVCNSHDEHQPAEIISEHISFKQIVDKFNKNFVPNMAKRSDIHSAVQEANELVMQAKAKIAEVEEKAKADLLAKSQETEQVKNELEEKLSTQTKEYVGKIETLETELACLISEKDRANERVKMLEHELSETHSQAERLEEANAALETANGKLMHDRLVSKEQLKNMNNRVSELLSAIKVAMEEKESLTQQLESEKIKFRQFENIHRENMRVSTITMEKPTESKKKHDLLTSFRLVLSGKKVRPASVKKLATAEDKLDVTKKSNADWVELKAKTDLETLATERDAAVKDRDYYKSLYEAMLNQSAAAVDVEHLVSGNELESALAQSVERVLAPTGATLEESEQDDEVQDTVNDLEHSALYQPKYVHNPLLELTNNGNNSVLMTC